MNTKTLLRLLITTLALGLTAVATAAQSPEEREAAAVVRLNKAVDKFEARGLVNAADAEHIKQNATGAKTAVCQSDIVQKVVMAIVKSKGATPADIDEALDYMQENKWFKSADYYKKAFSNKTLSGTATRNILLSLSNHVK